MYLSDMVRWRHEPKKMDPAAEAVFLAIAFRVAKEWCVCTKKELARQVGLSVADLNAKLRLLRELDLIWTYAARDGYIIFLKDENVCEWQPSTLH